MRKALVVTALGALVWAGGPQVFAQFEASITDPQPLNGNAGTDNGKDERLDLATDGSGNWVAVWMSDEPAIGGGIGTDMDILVARSTDNGTSWSAPQALNTNADTDLGADVEVDIETDGAGNWVVVWWSREADIGPGQGIGTDEDILVARSTDNGASWSTPEALNTNARTDVCCSPGGGDSGQALATDRAGNWVTVWHSLEARIGGGIGTDRDILVARSTDNGASWTDPEAMNTNAGTDSGNDENPGIATDGAGTWITLWHSREAAIGGGIGTDQDILFAQTTNNGVSWSAPQALNTNAGTDDSDDWYPQITTDASGNWVAVWYSREADIGGENIGTDMDILVAHSTDNGATWSAPQALNTNAATDVLHDREPHITTDGVGNWVVVWNLQEVVLPGPDRDVMVSRSTDNGASWSAPQALNSNAGVDVLNDRRPQIATDEAGNWVVLWFLQEVPNLPGPDRDVMISRSTDNGASWSAPQALNTNADTDTGNDVISEGQGLAVDRAGHWVAAWYSEEPDISGGIGTDRDILVARFAFACEEFVDDSVYGRLVFPPLCTLDAAGLAQDLYDSATVGIARDNADSFFLSSESTTFAPLVVDDAIHLNNQGSGLGPYSYQPGAPPFFYDVPIEHNLAPLPAHDVTGLIPMGSTQVLFELLDTQREIYGNTAVYLVRDCGIYLGKGFDTKLHWVSHDVEIEGFQSNLDVVTGVISELRADGDFTRASCLGSFLDTTQAVDTRPDPSVSDGYYYLVSGTCAQPIGYGYSDLVPSPRDNLAPTVCP